MTDELIDIETDLDDPRPWVRDYMALGAVQGDFRDPSALAVVERAQHPEQHDQVRYHVHRAIELPAETPVPTVAEGASQAAESYGAARCILDATTAGAPMLRSWTDCIARPREFFAVHIADRERPELRESRRFDLSTVARLDIFGAIRMALGVTGGLTYGSGAHDAKQAIAEYQANPPKPTQDEQEWAPPDTWHMASATALAVWLLMEEPPEFSTQRGAFSRRDLDAMRDDKYRFDRSHVRDMSAIEQRQQEREQTIPPPKPLSPHGLGRNMPMSGGDATTSVNRAVEEYLTRNGVT